MKFSRAVVVCLLLASSAAFAVAPQNAAQIPPWGFDLTGMDPSVRPGDDFNAYASGKWATRTTIPADRPSFGAFAALREESDAAVRKILEKLPQAAGTPATEREKLAALYASYLDEAAIEARGAAPLKPLLDAVAAIPDKHAFVQWMGNRHGSFGGALFSAYIGADAKNPDYTCLEISQSGLSLPDRDYYLAEKFATQRAAFLAYVTKLFTLANYPEPQHSAQALMAFETELAKAHWTRAESRDRDKTYNPTTLVELEAAAPGFEWTTYLTAAGLASANKIVVSQKTALPPMSKAFADADLATLKAWQAFKIIDEAAPLLSKAFVDAHFDFRQKFLTGVPEPRSRVKRAASFVESEMGEAVGREYVAEYFPPESKAKMEALVANIQTALRARIQNLTWMSDETKQKALAKLGKFTVKIGYPIKWRDYSKLEVSNDLFTNALAARKFGYDFMLSKLNQKVDKDEWGMTPQTVNAYYNSTQNEIVFPAAILQPPFFDPHADMAVNYGGIGAVIGHEITHGFDDQGRKSDGNGMLTDWWTKQDAEQFEAQALKLGDQYESYSFSQAPRFKIIARATMGENIADLGGILVSLDAYHLSLNGKDAPVLDGFTGDQRFFLGWAQVWRTLTRDAALIQQLATDPHSPGQIRAFAPLRNVDAWYAAFHVEPGDKNYLAPQDRVRIW